MKPVLTIGILAGAVAFFFKDQIADAFSGSNTLPATTTPPPSGGTTTPPPSGGSSTTTPPPSSGGTTTPPPSGGGSTTTPPPSGGSTAAPAAKTVEGFAAYVATMEGRDPRLSADGWNYYWSAYFGVQQTADLFTPGNRGELINFTTYLQRRSSAGLSAARPARQFLSSNAWGRS